MESIIAPENPMIVEMLSPAKINLFLDIAGLREDGYHRLTLVNAKVSLQDRIACRLIPPPEIQLTANGLPIPLDSSNTAHHAARRFRDLYGLPLGVRIHIEKQIPQGAGLGGGSSNAAAVLTALNQLTGNQVPIETLRECGARIGADVPFFLYEGCCLCEGIGEQVTPLPVSSPEGESPLRVVLCHPDEHVSTPRAYALWDQAGNPPHASPQPLIQALKNQNWERVPGCLFNAFESVIFANYPVIQQAYEVFRNISPTPPRLTGSGSNLYSLHTRREEAIEVANGLEQQGLRATVCDLIL